ncbi:hypothetical protein CDAR_583321 [Caerostris darwini]|uniref:ATP synthase F0 subunit 8 n=1 Tax=Caerostris darwini TaxID=1538125 RepID=A0AAV4V991_9ARAC|nr:hypothetical protein CDAR_583321 [Caerostris darwini]
MDKASISATSSITLWLWLYINAFLFNNVIYLISLSSYGCLMTILEDLCKAGKRNINNNTKITQTEEKPAKDQKIQVCALQITTFSQTEASFKITSSQVVVEKTDKCTQTKNVG